MSEIKVVPCPIQNESVGRFALLVDGVLAVNQFHVHWCGTEAEALEKAAELRGEQRQSEGLTTPIHIYRSDEPAENPDPVEQAAPPRPLDSEALDFLDEFYHAKRYLYVPNILYIRIGEILEKAGRL